MVGERSGPTTALDVDEVDRLLVEAIQDADLRPTLDRLVARSDGLTAEARARVDRAVDALDALEADVTHEKKRLLEMLVTAGVKVRSRPGPTDRPLHQIELEVDRADVERVATALTNDGYRRLGATGAAAWRSIQATWGYSTFVAAEPPFRVELGWELHRPGLIGRIVRPHQSDYDAVTLPTMAWPAYSLLHLLRLPVRRWLRQDQDLGPFLATPTALIEPLLRLADPGPDDLVVDLGCGDGRIVVAAARAIGCRARGVEADPELAARARKAVKEAGLTDRVEIVQGDAFTVPLADARVVVAFLPVGMLDDVVTTALYRMAPGAILLVHEQQRITTRRPPDASVPLISGGGITVVHRWNR